MNKFLSLCIVLALLQGAFAISSKVRAVQKQHSREDGSLTGAGSLAGAGSLGGAAGGSLGGAPAGGSLGGDLGDIPTDDIDVGADPTLVAPAPVEDMALPTATSNSLSTPSNSQTAQDAATIDQSIANAQARLDEINNQLSLDVTTSQDWYEVLQNYQFKYSALLARIKTNEEKKDELEELITKMKNAAQSTQATRELEALRNHLGSLVLNAETVGDEDSKAVYEELQGALADMDSKLAPVTATAVSTAVNDVIPEVNPTADGEVPGSSIDTIAELTMPAEADGDDVEA